HSGSIKAGTVFVNDSGWSSKETDDLMNKATVEVDPARRGELYHQFQKDVVEASPLVYIMELDFVTVYNKKVHDWLVSPLGMYSSFDQAWSNDEYMPSGLTSQSWTFLLKTVTKSSSMMNTSGLAST